MTGLGVGALLFVWAVGALLGGDDSPAVRGAANIQPAGVPLTSGATSRTTSAVPSSDPPATGRLAIRGGPSSSSAAPTTVPTATLGTTTTAPPTTTPAVPQPCPDSVMRVTVTSDQPGYPVGGHPVLTLHIANVGPVACVRDVSHQLRSIEILAAGGTTPVWMSSDCYALTTHEVPTLAPGQSLAFSVTWAGRTAAPGCPSNRTTVPAGNYEIVGKLGNLTSPPTPFTLR